MPQNYNDIPVEHHESFLKPLFYIQTSILAVAIFSFLCIEPGKPLQYNQKPQYAPIHNSPEIKQEAIPENTDRFSYGSIDTLLNVK